MQQIVQQSCGQSLFVKKNYQTKGDCDLLQLPPPPPPSSLNLCFAISIFLCVGGLVEFYELSLLILFCDPPSPHLYISNFLKQG